MEGERVVSRRSVLVLGGVVAGAALSRGVGGAEPKAAHAGDVSGPARPCLGEPGYAERIARLFEAPSSER